MNATDGAMRGRGRHAAVFAVATALVLGACGGGSSSTQGSGTPSTTATISGSSPSASASATPTPRPSDQQAQAYAAAVKVYRQYWGDLFAIINNGGDPTRMRSISRGAALSYAIQVADGAISRGYKVRGSISDVYLKPTGFNFGGTAKKPSVVTLATCRDLSTIGYVDAKGKPVPRSPGAAKFVRYDYTVVNSSPSLTKAWQLQGIKSTVVKSCE